MISSFVPFNIFYIHTYIHVFDNSNIFIPWELNMFFVSSDADCSGCLTSLLYLLALKMWKFCGLKFETLFYQKGFVPTNSEGPGVLLTWEDSSSLQRSWLMGGFWGSASPPCSRVGSALQVLWAPCSHLLPLAAAKSSFHLLFCSMWWLLEISLKLASPVTHLNMFYLGSTCFSGKVFQRFIIQIETEVWSCQ